MRRGGAISGMGFCAVMACALAVHAQTVAPEPDPATKVALFGAAFANDAPAPAPQKAMAMAFLPGRGVVAWDVTGKTAEEAKEAQIEAMGLADARAVQREIDQAAAQKEAQLAAEQSERLVVAGGSAGRGAGLAMPVVASAAHEAGAVIPLKRAAPRDASVLGVKSGDTVKGAPHLYAFAAASGRSAGFNVLHDDAGWKNAGLTTDRDGATGQRQAGLAWRKGLVQTSVSYVQEKDRVQVLGVQSEKDHRVMLTMNMPPQAILGLFDKKP